MSDKQLTPEDIEQMRMAWAQLVQDIRRNVVPTIEGLAVAVRDIVQQALPAVRDIVQQALPPLLEAGKNIYAGVKAAYEVAGSPYGPSSDHENVMRWVTVLMDQARAQREKEYQLEREQMILGTHKAVVKGIGSRAVCGSIRGAQRTWWRVP